MLTKHLQENIFKTPGLYVLSQSKPTNYSKKKFKIGIAKKNLQERIDSYHTCFPDSFWVYAAIKTKTAKDALKLENEVKKRVGKNRAIGVKQDQNKEGDVGRPLTGGEWYEGKQTDVMKMVTKIFEEFDEALDMVVFDLKEIKKIKEQKHFLGVSRLEELQKNK